MSLLSKKEIEDIRKQVAKARSETLENENGHKYGCECDECIQLYRKLK